MSVLPGTDRRRRIYLMRHAHVDYFSSSVRDSGDTHNVKLTDKGVVQATATAHALAGIHFDRAICSGLPRTKQTAEIVLSKLDTEVPELEIRSEFRELESGPRDGDSSDRAELSKSDLANLVLDNFRHANMPGRSFGQNGETFETAYERSSRGLEKLLAEPGWHTTLLVAHEGINRCMLGWATGSGLNLLGAFEQDLACVNVLDFDMMIDNNGNLTDRIDRVFLKSMNLTLYNTTKNGMNETSIESIFPQK